MLEDKIIELDNGDSYYIISDIEYNGRVYAMAAEIDLENDEINTDDLVIKEIIPVGESLEIKTVPNEELESISKLLYEKVANEEKKS